MDKQKALVIFSGGQDSTTCLIKAINDYGLANVRTISFQYGQRHAIELDKAKKICELLNVQQKIVVLNELNQVTDNALMNIHTEILTTECYPNTFVVGRNALFILYAAIYAQYIKFKNIILGVSQVDYSGYPDCRFEFIQAMNKTINLAMDESFIIHTPLMFLTKKDIWKLADDMGYLQFIQENTHTCYLGVEGGCGRCPSCILRNQGLKQYLKNK